MVKYQEAFTMPYGDWLARKAARKRISPEDLDRIVVVESFCVRVNSYGDAYADAIKAFDNYARRFDYVTDLVEGEAGRFTFLGTTISANYFIRGTGIHFIG